MTKTLGTAFSAPVATPAIYLGTLSHHRYGPGPAHSFSYPVAMPYLALGSIARDMSAHPLWSASHPAPVWFRRSDYLGDRTKPLAEEVKDVVRRQTGDRPDGPVMMLSHLRTWGWLFNPITLYFCLSTDGRSVRALVAEVENTPWHERHQYVLGPPGEHVVAKALHVSPFLPMHATYQIYYDAPGATFALSFRVHGDGPHGDGRPLLVARLSLDRQPFDRRELTNVMTHYPAMAHKISVGIYSQAARLALKGAPFFRHPRARTGRGCCPGTGSGPARRGRA